MIGPRTIKEILLDAAAAGAGGVAIASVLPGIAPVNVGSVGFLRLGLYISAAVAAGEVAVDLLEGAGVLSKQV